VKTQVEIHVELAKHNQKDNLISTALVLRALHKYTFVSDLLTQKQLWLMQLLMWRMFLPVVCLNAYTHSVEITAALYVEW